MANEITDHVTEFPKVRNNKKDNSLEEGEPSKKGLTEKPFYDINSVPPPPEPDAGLGDEFIVKKEWIE